MSSTAEILFSDQSYGKLKAPEDRPNLQLVDETYVTGPPPIVDVLIDRPMTEESTGSAPIIELNEYIKGLLESLSDKHTRNKLAVYYGGYYRHELEVDVNSLSYDQQSNIVLAKLYLSSLSSLGQLGLFIETNRWMGRKAPETDEAKVRYLASRKIYQDDVDTFFEHFSDEPEEILLDTLKDISNLARLTIKQRKFIDAATDDHTHVFVGSVLSERLVKISMQEFVDPGTRYGDEDEDRSPTKADVVWPRPEGDVHVQVKMKWTKPTELKVKPKKKPPHVIVPMQSIRGSLTPDEHLKVATIITEVAKRQEKAKKWEEACALSGIKKHLAMWRITREEFRAWWLEMQEIIKSEKQSYNNSLQTGVDELKLSS